MLETRLGVAAAAADDTARALDHLRSADRGRPAAGGSDQSGTDRDRSVHGRSVVRRHAAALADDPEGAAGGPRGEARSETPSRERAVRGRALGGDLRRWGGACDLAGRAGGRRRALPRRRRDGGRAGAARGVDPGHATPHPRGDRCPDPGRPDPRKPGASARGIPDSPARRSIRRRPRARAGDALHECAGEPRARSRRRAAAQRVARRRRRDLDRLRRRVRGGAGGSAAARRLRRDAVEPRGNGAAAPTSARRSRRGRLPDRGVADRRRGGAFRPRDRRAAEPACADPI